MNGDKPEKPGFKEVINSVDTASSKELVVLSRIEKGLTEGLVSAGSTPAKETPDTNTSRSVALNQQRKAQQDKKRRKNAKKHPRSNDKATIEQPNSVSVPSSGSKENKPNINQPKDNQKTVSRREKNQPAKQQSKTNQEPTIKQDSEEALKILRSPVRQGGERDTKGRFTSRDKVNSDKEDRAQNRHDKEQEENARKENELLTRVGKIFSALGDPMEADSTNAAGTAAGGSFWKAGQEAYTMAKNVGGGALDAGRKMKDVMGGGEDEDGARKPGLLRRAFSRKKNKGSQNVIAKQVQKQQVDATENQTEQIKEGNKEITDRLDDLLDKQGGGGAGKGLWGSLGGLVGKAFRKPIMAVGKLLSKVILAPFVIAAAVMKTAFNIGKKILLKVMALAGGAAAKGGLDDLTDGGIPDREGKKKKNSKKNRKPGKQRKPKKPNIFKRLFKSKGAKIAGGVAATAATGYAANEVMDLVDGDEVLDTDEPKKKTPDKKVASEESAKTNPAEQKTASSSTEKSVSAEKSAGAEKAASAEKTVAPEKSAAASEKIATKETTAVAKTEQAVGKETTAVAKGEVTKVAEKGVLKVAEEGGEKLALKAGAKVAAKTVGKVALRSIPIVGQIAGAGIDAVTGWMDTEGQQNTFGLKPDQVVSGRQKTEYTAANILDMGGLVSGAAGLLSSGADALGMDGVAKALDFDTGDIAKMIDKGVGDSISAVKSVTDSIGITGNDKKAEERNKSVVEAVKKGASDTIDAINKLVTGGIASVRNVITGNPDNSPVSIGNVKAPVASKTGKMQLDTMAAKFADLEQKNGLPAGLLRGVATTESGGDNGAVSGAGAKGMFQFMPKTATEYGLHGNDVYDPDKSAEAAAKKLGGLVKLYKGDVGLALSAYNWGEGNIQRKGMGAAPKETREYAPKVFAAMQAAGAKTAVTQQTGQPPQEQLANVAPGTATMPIEPSLPVAPAASTDPTAPATGTTSAAIVLPEITINPTVPAGGDPSFTPSKLPTDEAAAQSIIGGSDGIVSTVIDNVGGDKLRNAEGQRHQVSATELQTLQSGQTPQSQQKVKETKEATAQARAAATGMFTRAKIPTDSQSLKDMPGGEFFSLVVNKYGGDKIANAEGLRHQASAAEIAGMQSGQQPATAVSAKQNVQPAALSIPSKMPVVKDMAASQMKPSVNVANEMALPKSVTRTWDSILKRLDEIAGHTKDTADKTGDKTPKANTAQPAPRGSVPLTVEDPLMSEVAHN